MTPKKSPTNYDLAADIKEIKQMLLTQGTAIKSLEDWKIGIEIAKSAVDEYKQREQSDLDQKLRNNEYKTKSDLFVKLAYVLGAIGLALYTYLSTKGIHA